MSQITTMEIDAAVEPNTSRERTAWGPSRNGVRKLSVAGALSKIIFVSLVSVIALSAIPYGTTHAWWKAFFVCIIFTLAILWLLEGLISNDWFKDSLPVVLPPAALAIFALLQTLPFGNQSANTAGIKFAFWNTLSADPYQTRFFALKLLALTITGVLLFRYVSTERRVRTIINVVICVAVASAIFGILRQTTQHTVGFGLPLLVPDAGYAQFINYNHFAFLMEMAQGLGLGLILAGGVKRQQTLLYLAMLVPIWTALVLSGSRGGLIAMLAQAIVAALLFSWLIRNRKSAEGESPVMRIARSWPFRMILILALIGGVVVGTVWLGGDRLAIKIEALHDEFNPDASGSHLGVSRNEIWKASWKLFVAHPVLGVGMGGYWAAIPAVHDASGTMTPQEAHNDYLELLASGGLVGLAIGVWFAVVVLRRMRVNLGSPNRFRRAACFGAVIGIAGVAVHSLVDFGLHTIVNALVFTTLIVIATSKTLCEGQPDDFGARI